MQRPFKVEFCERVIAVLEGWISYDEAEQRVVEKRLKEWRKELAWARRVAHKHSTPEPQP